MILSYSLTRAVLPVTSSVLIIRSSGSESEYFATSLLYFRYPDSSPESLINRFAFFSSISFFHHKSKNSTRFEISEPSLVILVNKDVASSDCVFPEYANDA